MFAFAIAARAMLMFLPRDTWTAPLPTLADYAPMLMMFAGITRYAYADIANAMPSDVPLQARRHPTMPCRLSRFSRASAVIVATFQFFHALLPSRCSAILIAPRCQYPRQDAVFFAQVRRCAQCARSARPPAPLLISRPLPTPAPLMLIYEKDVHICHHAPR